MQRGMYEVLPFSLPLLFHFTLKIMILSHPASLSWRWFPLTPVGPHGCITLHLHRKVRLCEGLWNVIKSEKQYFISFSRYSDQATEGTTEQSRLHSRWQHRLLFTTAFVLIKQPHGLLTNIYLRAICRGVKGLRSVVHSVTKVRGE
jgi:hypothetical protein